VVPIDPYVCVIGPDGHYGCFDARARIVGPVVTLSRSGKELRVTGSPSRGPVLDADGIVARYVTEMLSRHDPEGKHGSLLMALATGETLVSRSDAQTLAAFVTARPDVFSRTTRILSRRLAEHYDISAESTDWTRLAGRYQIERRFYGSRPELEELLPIFKPDARDSLQEQLGEFMAQEPRSADAKLPTCGLCGNPVPNLAAVRRNMMTREMLPRFLELFDNNIQPKWRTMENGLICVELCQECFGSIAKKRRQP
jgi:hypothetical protein